MIKNIQIGEIISIGLTDYIIVNTPHKNGRIDWEQPTLIQLEHFIKKTPKKFRGCDKTISPFRKIKSIKLTRSLKNEM